MAISCPWCGAGYDVTLFEFGHRVTCACGAVLEYPGDDCLGGHVAPGTRQHQEDRQMAEVELGRVTHYFSKIGVAAIEITQDTLAVGDTIHVKGHTSDFSQKIDSMQIDGKSVEEVTVGQSVGLKVIEHAREHDMVYKVIE
jgi:translation initiation factor IF-2